jgi:hypothetical protein
MLAWNVVWVLLAMLVGRVTGPAGDARREGHGVLLAMLVGRVALKRCWRCSSSGVIVKLLEIIESRAGIE